MGMTERNFASKLDNALHANDVSNLYGTGSKENSNLCRYLCRCVLTYLRCRCIEKLGNTKSPMKPKTESETRKSHESGNELGEHHGTSQGRALNYRMLLLGWRLLALRFYTRR